MYRCQVCKKRTEDIDEAPCNPANHVFRPEHIRTLHKYIYDRKNKTVTVLCTGNAPRRGTEGLGGNYGITCVRCKTKMKELARLEKDILSSRETGVPGAELAQPVNTDTLPAEE